MKLFFFVLAISAQIAFGQCTFNVSGSDITCTDDHDCLSTDGCSLTIFTVPCEGCYCLEVSLDCGSESCKNCRVCANIYDDGVIINTSNCHTTFCSGESCEFDCCQFTENAFPLEANKEYKLYVCKIACPTFDCSDCESSCLAKATLHQSSVTSCD